MNVLVIGSGAREHALGWAIARTPGSRLWFLPGNAGTLELGPSIIGVDPGDGQAVMAAAARLRAELVVVGPEEPLERGLADALRGSGVAVFGPGRSAARLETSKEFSKAFMTRHGVPTAAGASFSDFAAFRRYLSAARTPLVVKKSGLAAGKGVLVSDETSELLEFGRAALEADSVVVEERLDGFELSVFVLMDGERHVVLPACADHKKAHDGDRGPNTGGMGAVCPVPSVDAALEARILREAVEPTLRGLRTEGLMYRGVLFLGLMVTTSACAVLEYNVRFGDPETQVLLPAVEADWLGLMLNAATGRLDGGATLRARNACVGVVVASPGYPDAYPKGIAVRALPAGGQRVMLFHASTTRDGDGTVRTGGGRCFTVVGSGPGITEARDAAYAAVEGVSFDGAWCRRDIGASHAR